MSLLPQAYLNAVIAIEREVHDGPEPRYQTIGTGFIVGLDFGERDEKGAIKYRILTVTNRHVIYGQEVLWIRMSRQGPCRA